MKQTKLKRFLSQKYLWLLIVPSLICVFLFNYAPMSGIYMAFTNYSPSKNGYIYDLTNASFV